MSLAKTRTWRVSANMPPGDSACSKFGEPHPKVGSKLAHRGTVAEMREVGRGMKIFFALPYRSPLAESLVFRSKETDKCHLKTHKLKIW